MRKTILARVVARALSFPEQIEVQCQPVDADGRPIGTAIYNFGPFTWEAVKHKFWIDEPYAAVCVKNFEEGSPALISSVLEWERDWPEPETSA